MNMMRQSLRFAIGQIVEYGPPLFIATFMMAIMNASVDAQQNQDIQKDIEQLLRESQVTGREGLQKYLDEAGNYTYKWRKIVRRKDSNHKLREESEVYEVYPPALRHKVKMNRGRLAALIEKNGKPVPADRIEKDRLKIGKRLESYQTDDQRSKEPRPEITCGSCLQFSVWQKTPMTSRSVAVSSDELIEKCDFEQVGREKVNGRQAIRLHFRPKPGAQFGDETGYLAGFEGEVWIDEKDRLMIRLTASPQGVKFERSDSAYLLENAAVVIDRARLGDGVWTIRLGRFDGIKYAGKLLWLDEEFSIEWFDHKRYQVDSEKEIINKP